MTLLAIPAFSTWIAPPGVLTSRVGAILQRQFDRIIAGAFLLALLSDIAAFWLIANTLIAETDADFGTLLTQTQFGRLFLLRLALIIAVGASLFCNVRGLTLLLSVGALGSLAWTGHAAASETRSFQIFVDVTHLLSAGIWPGTLLPLTCFLALNEENTQTIVKRFSASSLIAVGFLSLSGCANAYFRLGSFNALLTTVYGHVLLLKIALFLMIAIAARNLYLVPRFKTSSLPELRRNVLAELILAIGVVLVVGFLGLLAP
jgi:putative copper export protein